jgi:hypothetical protein
MILRNLFKQRNFFAAGARILLLFGRDVLSFADYGYS